MDFYIVYSSNSPCDSLIFFKKNVTVCKFILDKKKIKNLSKPTASCTSENI